MNLHNFNNAFTSKSEFAHSLFFNICNFEAKVYKQNRARQFYEQNELMGLVKQSLTSHGELVRFMTKMNTRLG